MEHLCCSFWFWLVVLASMAVLVLATGFLGYFTGIDVGRKSENLKWEMRVKSLYRKWRRDAGLPENGGENVV